MIPQDPAMLLSFINMKLRDRYKDLHSLCEDLDISEEELCQKLARIGCKYSPEQNRFL